MNHASRIIATLVLLVSIMLCTLALASPAHANSIRVSCDYYATNHVDPIAFADHLHHQFGNTSTTNTSTYESLYANKDTSCNGPWWTNAGWVPVERNEPQKKADVYYRCPGDPTECVNIPNGIKMIAHYEEGVSYNCGAGPGDTAPYQATPIYSCSNNWTTQVRFPACWDGFGVEPTDTTYGATRSSCPAGYVRLPEISVLVTHQNSDGVVPRPLEVSCGFDEWCGFTSMHGDYFFAAQDEFNNNVDLDGDGRIEIRDSDGNGRYEPWLAHGDSEQALIDLCIRKGPESLEFPNARCRAGGLLDSHIKALKNYYG